MDDESAVRALYRQMLAGWNNHDAAAMAAPFAPDGETIGFDGSRMNGRDEIEATLGDIFAHHTTAPYIDKIKQVRFLSPDAALLSAIVGMIPVGRTELEPKLNANQTVVAVKTDGKWQIALLQTTPAQLHGRPDLVEQMTEELRQQIA